jgi:large subunit ribosomal protein L1
MASKRLEKAVKQVDKPAYSLAEAVKVLKDLPGAKFDETVEISGSLNIDPKKTDQVVRGTTTLPHGTGRARRVIVFCKGEQELLAKQAGAEHVGGAELVAKIQEGWLDFDVAVATPEMMREVSKLGKVLGPRGMMPNPKIGTVTMDVAKAVEEVKRGKVEFKTDKLSNIHVVIGKRSFEPQKLLENGQTVIDAVVRARPSSLKGKMIRRLSLSSTMSPGIPLAIEGLEDSAIAEQ